MRKIASIISIAAIAGFAACSTDGDNQVEVPDPNVDVDASVGTDTLTVPEVDVGVDTATVKVPDVDVKMPSDTNRRPPQ
ncbi:MAG TPA: hypothetical protein VGE02_08965 [Gemmatimonadales bacterium]